MTHYVRRKILPILKVKVLSYTLIITRYTNGLQTEQSDKNQLDNIFIITCIFCKSKRKNTIFIQFH